MKTKPKIELDIQKVEELAGLGLTREEIALSLGVSYSTLNRRAKEFEEVETAIQRGRALANIKVAGELMKAIEGGNVTAIIFYLKTRAGWTEKIRTEVTGADGEALKVDNRIDLSVVPLEDLKAARALLYPKED